MPETEAPDSGSKNSSGSLHVLHHRLLATSLSCFNKNYFHSSEHGTKVQLNVITRGFGNKCNKIVFFKFLLDTCPFLGPLIPLFRTSGDVSSGFQSQSGQPYSHLAEVYVLHIP